MGGRGSGFSKNPINAALQEHIKQNPAYTRRQLAGLLVTNSPRFAGFGASDGSFKRLLNEITKQKLALRKKGLDLPRQKGAQKIKERLIEAHRKSMSINELHRKMAEEGMATTTRSLWTRAKQLGLEFPGSWSRKKPRVPHRH